MLFSFVLDFLLSVHKTIDLWMMTLYPETMISTFINLYIYTYMNILQGFIHPACFFNLPPFPFLEVTYEFSCVKTFMSTYKRLAATTA